MEEEIELYGRILSALFLFSVVLSEFYPAFNPGERSPPLQDNG
jgi:hypothetical protein